MGRAPGGIAIFGALFTACPPTYIEYAYGQPGSDGIQTSRDRFSKAGKTILDPSMRSSIPCRGYQLSC